MRAQIAGSLALVFLMMASTGCSGLGAAPEAEIGNMPSKGPVGKTIRSNSTKFVACGRDSVTIQTGATQELLLRFVVESDGHVQKAHIERMSMPDPDLQSCVLRVLKKLRFPAPRDQKPKEIHYPLVLKS